MTTSTRSPSAGQQTLLQGEDFCLSTSTYPRKWLPRDQWEREHAEYLQSPEWQERRVKVLDRSGGVCEACGVAKATTVHHVTYRRWKNEPLFDLRAVCTPCHELIHGKQQEEDMPAIQAKPSISFVKRIPQDIEAEQRILGAMVIEPSAASYAWQNLNAEDFHREAHRIIFQWACIAYQRDGVVDLLRLREVLHIAEILEECGGFNYLVQLTDSVDNASQIKTDCLLVRELSIFRKIQDVVFTLDAINRDDYSDIEEVLRDTRRIVAPLLTL